MKVLKVYGAPGYMEWRVTLYNGATRLNLLFENGSQTAYGVAPAEYRTDSPFVQTLIEVSEYFKKGRIVLLDEVALESEEEDVPEEPAPFVHTEETEDVSGAYKGEKLVFASVDDARDYAVEHLGVAVSVVRSRASLEKILTEAGLEFEIQ